MATTLNLFIQLAEDVYAAAEEAVEAGAVNRDGSSETPQVPGHDSAYATMAAARAVLEDALMSAGWPAERAQFVANAPVIRAYYRHEVRRTWSSTHGQPAYVPYFWDNLDWSSESLMPVEAAQEIRQAAAERAEAETDDWDWLTDGQHEHIIDQYAEAMEYQGPYVEVFRVDDDTRLIFPELQGVKEVGVYSDDQGFIYQADLDVVRGG